MNINFLLSLYWIYWNTIEIFDYWFLQSLPLHIPTHVSQTHTVKISCLNTSTLILGPDRSSASLYFENKPRQSHVNVLYFCCCCLLLFYLRLIICLKLTETEKCDVPFHSLQILIEDLFYLFPKLYPQETSCLNSDYAEAKWSWYEKQRAVLRAQSPFSHNWLIVNIFLKNYCQPWTVQLFHFFSVLLAVPAIVGN